MMDDTWATRFAEEIGYYYDKMVIRLGIGFASAVPPEIALNAISPASYAWPQIIGKEMKRRKSKASEKMEGWIKLALHLLATNELTEQEAVHVCFNLLHVLSYLVGADPCAMIGMVKDATRSALDKLVADSSTLTQTLKDATRTYMAMLGEKALERLVGAAEEMLSSHHSFVPLLRAALQT